MGYQIENYYQEYKFFVSKLRGVEDHLNRY